MSFNMRHFWIISKYPTLLVQPDKQSSFRNYIYDLPCDFSHLFRVYPTILLVCFEAQTEKKFLISSSFN